MELLLEEYLGISIKDNGIQKKLSNMKDFFEAENAFRIKR